MPMPFLKKTVCGLALVASLMLAPFQAHAQNVTVFAAASLKNVLTTIAENWKARTGNEVVLSFAGSSALAKQIVEGAPADIFISADLDWMDHVQKSGDIDERSRVDLLANRIVLIAPATAATTARIEPGFPLATLLGDGRLAMANIDSVPAGKYGKAALEKLGVWDSVKDKVAQAENVRAALLLVSRQEAPLGIVYETDAKVDAGVKILDRFPQDSHPPIVYPAAILKNAASGQAADFLAYLTGEKSAEAFTKAGFTVLKQKN